MRETVTIRRMYDLLLERYGRRGWWPLLSLAGSAGFDADGYHPGLYDVPRCEDQRFEVIVGAILTQNTAWTNAALALRALRHGGLLNRERLAACSPTQLAGLIRSSGYFNQKARKLGSMLSYLDAVKTRTREGLLGVWGIGPETADSILLYAEHEPVFVVDAYTTRLLVHLGLVPPGAPYHEVQAIFHRALPAEPALFNEYHALIVEHGKRHYSRRPHGLGDPLADVLRSRSGRAGRCRGRRLGG